MVLLQLRAALGIHMNKTDWTRETETNGKQPHSYTRTNIETEEYFANVLRTDF